MTHYSYKQIKNNSINESQIDYNKQYEMEENVLNDISSQLNILKFNGNIIGDKLDVSNDKLNNVIVNVDDETHRINNVTHKTNYLINKISTNWFCYSMLIMTVIIIILLFILLK